MIARVSPEEEDLILRLLDTLLRENIIEDDASRLPGWFAVGRVRIPVRPARPGRDLLADVVARAPFVVFVRPGRRVVVRRLAAVVNVLAAELRDAELVAGFATLRAEALAALLAARLRRRSRPRVLGEVRTLTGWAGHVELETLAAHRDHPLYPTSLARVGLSASGHTAWAPEHRPVFDLHWYTTDQPVERHGERPDFWPDVLAVPLHPATAPPPGATRLDAPPLTVRPGLSLRTVVPVHDPSVHLKLPVPVRTLGRLNLRSLPRRGLADGARLTGLLNRVRAGDPGLDRLGVADETTWLHADPMFAVLVRRWPAVPPDALVAPVAALPLLPLPRDRSPDEFVAQYLRLLLELHVGLWLRHGIVLEAHPQNVLLVVVPGNELRLLVRDLDSARIDPGLVPTVSDPRLVCSDPGELADLFVTTTLHQCVAATLIALARTRHRPAEPWLRRVRPLLADLADRHPHARDTPLLVSRILDAPRLPVKRHLTAATLLPKLRTAAADVNKFYGADAPTYL